MLSEQWRPNKARESILMWHSWRISKIRKRKQHVPLTNTHYRRELSAEFIREIKALEALAAHCEYWQICNNNLTKERWGRGRKSERSENMMKWGNKEEKSKDTRRPRTWERSQKRQMGHEWMQMRCKEAWHQRRQCNPEMERRRHQRMSNVKFIPVRHRLHLTSLHSPRVQTALHQRETRFLPFLMSLKTDILL